MGKQERQGGSKKLRSAMLSALIVFLFVVGGLLTMSKPIRNGLIAKTINTYQVDKVDPEKLKKNLEVSAEYNFNQIEPIRAEQVILSQFSSQEMPVVGGIAIPDIGLNLPIFQGLTNENVSFGAATMKEGQSMGKGNYALASHNVTGFINDSSLLFTPLTQAKKGMALYITDGSDVYIYRTERVFVLDPKHSEVIEDHPGETEITLVTCADPGATKRIVVQGSFEKKIPYDGKNKEVKAAFSKSYNPIF